MNSHSRDSEKDPNSGNNILQNIQWYLQEIHGKSEKLPHCKLVSEMI